MDTIGIGILSHAHGHVNTYCRVMQDFEDVRLAATWDDNVERGHTAADSFGLDFRDNPEAVVDDPAIDAVIIASETNRHADHVELAAAAGKHILLQKPMATTLADCDRIVKAVADSGVKFSMAFQMRHDPVNRKIRDLLAENAVGKISMIRRRHCINVLLNEAFVNGPSRWHMDPVANIGMFFDDATHAADWFFWLFGQPESVVAEIDQVVTDVSPDDNGAAIYRFREGEIGILLNSSTTVAGVNTTEIYGTEGTIVQDYGDAPSTSAPRAIEASPLRLIRTGDKEWTEFQMPIPTAQSERIAAIPRPFVDYVRDIHHEHEHVPAEDGRVSVEMVLGAYRSAAEGRRVLFPLAEG